MAPSRRSGPRAGRLGSVESTRPRRAGRAGVAFRTRKGHGAPIDAGPMTPTFGVAGTWRYPRVEPRPRRPRAAEGSERGTGGRHACRRDRMPGSTTSRHVAQVSCQRAETPSSEGGSTRGGRPSCDGGIRRRSRAGVPPDDAAGSMVAQARSSGACPRARVARRTAAPRPPRAVRRARPSRGHRVVGGTSAARSPGQPSRSRPRSGRCLPREAEASVRAHRSGGRTTRRQRPSETPAHRSRIDRRESRAFGFVASRRRGRKPRKGRQPRERQAKLDGRETLKRRDVGRSNPPGSRNRTRGGATKVGPFRREREPWRGEGPGELRAALGLTRRPQKRTLGRSKPLKSGNARFGPARAGPDAVASPRFRGAPGSGLRTDSGRPNDRRGTVPETDTACPGGTKL